MKKLNGKGFYYHYAVACKRPAVFPMPLAEDGVAFVTFSDRKTADAYLKMVRKETGMRCRFTTEYVPPEHAAAFFRKWQDVACHVRHMTPDADGSWTAICCHMELVLLGFDIEELARVA